MSRSISRVHSNRCNLRLFHCEKPIHCHSSRHLLPFDSSLLFNFTFRPALLIVTSSCRTLTILMSSPVEAPDIISLSRLASQSSRRCHTQLAALLELLSQKVRLLCISVLNTFKYLICIKLILTLLPSFFLFLFKSFSSCSQSFLYIASRMTLSESVCFSNIFFNPGIC